MNKDNRPLFQLTVAEYIEINRSLLIESARNVEPLKVNAPDKPDKIFIEEAAKLLCYTEKTIYTKVSRRELPIVSAGRPLTFSRKQLNDWMANGRPSIAEMIAEDFVKQKKK
jgi:excisionase family DNA binding protein